MRRDGVGGARPAQAQDASVQGDRVPVELGLANGKGPDVVPRLWQVLRSCSAG